MRNSSTSIVLVALALSVALASAQATTINPNGPQPYRAVDPVYAPVSHEAAVPNVAYVPPELFLKGDEARGSDAGPQPYMAPTPSY